MKKKEAKRHLSSKQKSQSIKYIRYASAPLLVLVVILAGKGLVSITREVHVLGAQTGPVLLADKGSDDSGGGSSSGSSSVSSGGGDSGGSSSSGSSGGSSGGNSGGGKSVSGGSSGGSSPSSVSDATRVDCVGPDGTHFTASFKSCSDFNNGWHHPNFTFTRLSSPQVQQTQKPEQKIKQEAPLTEVKHTEENFIKPDKLEVKTEDERSKVKLKQDKGEIHIESEGNNVMVKAKNPDGTELEFEKEDALKQLNESLKEKEVELGENEHSNLTITKGEVEAETELPVSVDPITHELTVTTQSGTKTVTVLPDKAIENLLNAKVLSSIESKASTQSGFTTQKATLTEINNEPVFKVKGVSQKKLLGFIPVAFAKTGFVSATTGQITKTDETLLNRILEVISF
jgi:hypothetical protein